MTKQSKDIRKIAEEVDTFDDMLAALVEVLEEKGVLTQSEWEAKIREKIEKKKNLRSYREIQFDRK